MPLGEFVMNRLVTLGSAIALAGLVFCGNAAAEATDPTMPEAPEYGSGGDTDIHPCADVTIQDLAGKVADQKHDGHRFKFRPADFVYNASLDLWMANDGSSTWVCQLNPNTDAISGDNLVYDFSARRSNVGAGAHNAVNRAAWGSNFIDDFTEEQNIDSCYVCGLVRWYKGCFPPGVKISVNDGSESKLVEDIAAGDVLWNPLTKTGGKVLSVVQGFENKPLLQIAAGELTLTVSDEHPIYTPSGLKQAKQLTTADTIVDKDGKSHTVSTITALPIKAGQTVINFTLEGGADNERLFLADGMVVGDLKAQKQLAAATR